MTPDCIQQKLLKLILITQMLYDTTQWLILITQELRKIMHGDPELYPNVI